MREISFPVSLFHQELDLKLISDAFKSLPSRDLDKGFRLQRANHPPRHDFNFYSFEGMSKLEGEIDVNFFNKLRRA
jgi:hypothetical protein